MLFWVRRVAGLLSQKVEGLSRVSHPLNPEKAWVDGIWPQGCLLLVILTDFGLLSPTNLCQIVLHHPGMSTYSSIDSIRPHRSPFAATISMNPSANVCRHSIHKMLVTQALLLFPNPLFSSTSPTLQLTSGSLIRIQLLPASKDRS